MVYLGSKHFINLSLTRSSLDDGCLCKDLFFARAWAIDPIPKDLPSVISRSDNNILPSSEMGAYHSRSYMTNINNDASSEMGWPTTHHHSKLATDVAIGNNAVQSNKRNLVSPEAGEIRIEKVAPSKSETIVKVCLCRHTESEHDRKWDINILFSDYYPCKSCQCDSFSIDETTRKRLSILSMQQWLRLTEQNKRSTVTVS